MWVTVISQDDSTPARAGYDSDSERIELGDDLFIHADTRVRTFSCEHEIEVRVTVVDGRLAADEVRVTRRDGGGAVTSERLRSIPVTRLVRYAAGAVQRVVERFDRGGESVDLAWPQESEFECVTLGLNDPTLRIVARVYRVAYLLGDAPTRSVQSVLDAPRATAGRWIAEARRRGFLSEARGPGKAGG